MLKKMRIVGSVSLLVVSAVLIVARLTAWTLTLKGDSLVLAQR